MSQRKAEKGLIILPRTGETSRAETVRRAIAARRAKTEAAQRAAAARAVQASKDREAVPEVDAILDAAFRRGDK